MIRSSRRSALAALLLFVGVAAVAVRAESGGLTLTLDAATRQRLGIEVVALAPMRLAASAESLARVVDPASLAQLDGEIAAALAAVAASRAEADRTEILFAEDQTVSARVRETARAELRADELRAEDARRRLRLTWGDGIARLDDAARRRLVADLLASRIALVRVELPTELAAASPTQIELTAPRIESAAWTARILGSLPNADADLQTAALLARADSSLRRLPVGLVLAARVPTGGSEESGVVLPRGALLRRESALWAYIERSATEFERRRVVGGRATADGWFVAAGFAPGESVVSAGAADLLAAERPVAPAGEAGDEDLDE